MVVLILAFVAEWLEVIYGSRALLLPPPTVPSSQETLLPPQCQPQLPPLLGWLEHLQDRHPLDPALGPFKLISPGVLSSAFYR